MKNVHNERRTLLNCVMQCERLGKVCIDLLLTLNKVISMWGVVLTLLYLAVSFRESSLRNYAPEN